MIKLRCKHCGYEDEKRFFPRWNHQICLINGEWVDEPIYRTYCPKCRREEFDEFTEEDYDLLFKEKSNELS